MAEQAFAANVVPAQFAQQQQQQGFYSRNKAAINNTAIFAGGVAVGVGGVLAYQYFTGEDGGGEKVAAKK